VGAASIRIFAFIAIVYSTLGPSQRRLLVVCIRYRVIPTLRIRSMKSIVVQIMKMSEWVLPPQIFKASLNQRVQGSSPCAPTKFLNSLFVCDQSISYTTADTCLLPFPRWQQSGAPGEKYRASLGCDYRRDRFIWLSGDGCDELPRVRRIPCSLRSFMPTRLAA
jgi:hypothetical protein